LRRERLKARERATGELHGRTAGWQIHHAHVAPPDAAAHAGAERLGAGFLGREALGVGLDALPLALAARGLGLRKHALGEAPAVALDRLGDPPHVGDIGADTEDHARPAATRPSSIALRIVFTACAIPPNTASPMRKCPMLSSTTSGSEAIFCA